MHLTLAWICLLEHTATTRGAVRVFRFPCSVFPGSVASPGPFFLFCTRVPWFRGFRLFHPGPFFLFARELPFVRITCDRPPHLGTPTWPSPVTA